MRVLVAILCLLAAPLLAQDRAGNNTPGEWVVDHHKPFGLWDSMCDHRVTGDVTEERCYLRYVDVFSPRPSFAAMFAFVTPGPEIDFGLETGTVFKDGGFRIEREGATVWSDPQAGCMVGLRCRWRGAEADALLATMADGGALVFDLTDRHGQPQLRQWDLAPFEAALDDFRAQARACGL